MAPMAQPPDAIPNGTMLPLNNLSGRNGSSAARAGQTKASASATEAPSIATMVGESQEKRLPPQVSTSMNTTAEAISSTPPAQSTLRLRWNTGILPILGSISANAPRPSGTLIQNTIDQCRCSANTPPSTGPPIPARVQTPLK